MLKRAFAFKWSASTLCPHRVYMWTFTRLKAEDCDVTRTAWNALLTMLKKWLPGWACLRVFERHPGYLSACGKQVSHGIHVHCLVPRFYKANIIRNISKRCSGWGRIDVQLFDSDEKAISYAAKYLTKRREPWAKGWRLWAACNVPGYTRVKDVTCDSLEGRMWAWLRQFPWFDGMSWPAKTFFANRALWHVRAAGIEVGKDGPMMPSHAPQDLRAKIYAQADWLGFVPVFKKAAADLGAMYFSINGDG